MHKVVAVKALPDFKLQLRYEDGTEGVADVSDLMGRGVFAELRDPDKFASVRVDASGAVAWGSDKELCPDSLYMRVTGQKPEDLFPSLRKVADA